MKKIIISLSVLCLFLLGCVTVVQGPQPPISPLVSLRFDNRLPYSIRNIVNKSRFEEIIADEPVRFPTYLSIEITGDRIISMVTFDIKGADTSAICYGDILSLGTVERYMNYLNEWLFAESTEWDANLSAAMQKYDYVFVVRFMRDNSFLEIDGKWPYNQYRFSRVEAKTPLSIESPNCGAITFRPTIKEKCESYSLY